MQVPKQIYRQNHSSLFFRRSFMDCLIILWKQNVLPKTTDLSFEIENAPEKNKDTSGYKVGKFHNYILSIQETIIF